ncbi:PREDICTED: uncharacterized protein LOC108556567 [Nicrophorus vespilloides]|uniref:Uncharacterized protein LOC108556567 n=1 Tax=Nicrophorus vespilloides TaxID=110193 RepID=A0ABM1M0X6_NICVS|nr:PREDICTED: uncharacterized protein LOC108556567 [Nicrophorus vespilloides]
MPKFDRYFRIAEKETRLVPIYWKICHILTLICADACCFLVAYNFEALLNAFGKNCVLNADLDFEDINKYNQYKPVGPYPYNMSFNTPSTHWGSKEDCNYCLFTNIFICIVGLILVSFFGIVSKGGAGNRGDVYTSPWTIVFPSILIGFVVSVVLFVAYIKLNIGIDAFCSEFSTQNNSTSCSQDLNVYTLIFNAEERDAYAYIQTIKICNFLALSFWCLFLATLILRLVKGSDFKITVYHLRRKNVIKEEDDTDQDNISDNSTELGFDQRQEVILAGKSKNGVTWL